MTGATPFATDAYHAASKRSVKIIAGIRYVSAKSLGDKTLGSGRCGEKTSPQKSPTSNGASCEPLFSTAGPNIDWIGTYVWQIRNWNYYSNHFRGYD